MVKTEIETYPIGGARSGGGRGGRWYFSI